MPNVKAWCGECEAETDHWLQPREAQTLEYPGCDECITCENCGYDNPMVDIGELLEGDRERFA